MPSKSSNGSAKKKTYAYLGPVGTFTELALAQVAEAKGQTWHPVSHVQEAIDLVVAKKAYRAIVPVENSVDGGVSATLDALAGATNIRIYGEYLVSISFDLVARPGVAIKDVKTVTAHPVAYAQTRNWLFKTLPKHQHLVANSNAQAAIDLLNSDAAEAAVSTSSITNHYKVKVLAKNIGENKHAQTRFIQIGLAGELPKRTGSDKTSVIVELPNDQPGGLLAMLEQFAARGVNLSRIESRPIGDRLGRYRFNIDVEGHLEDDAVSEALKGLHRFSPSVLFLGSYARADKGKSEHRGNNSNTEFGSAEAWLKKLKSGK